MSFEIQFRKDNTLITYGDIVKKNDMKNAFLKVTETVCFENLKFIIHDFSQTISFSIPDNYLEEERIITKFSTYWNPNITIIAIATNKNIESLFSGIIKYGKDLTWEYLLFNNWKEVLTSNKNLTPLNQHQFSNQLLP